MPYALFILGVLLVVAGLAVGCLWEQRQRILTLVLGDQCGGCGLRVFPRDVEAHYRSSHGA